MVSLGVYGCDLVSGGGGDGVGCCFVPVVRLLLLPPLVLGSVSVSSPTKPRMILECRSTDGRRCNSISSLLLVVVLVYVFLGFVLGFFFVLVVLCLEGVFLLATRWDSGGC